MLYEYECRRCEKTHEATRPVEKRATVSCPHCGAAPVMQTILISGQIAKKFTKTPSLKTEAEIVSEKGADWRETPGSRRMARGEPEKLYFGARRK
jgi:putative FmdB family regulatory protein